MSKLMVSLFMMKTRLIVNTYTVTTLPAYYIIQKPWMRLKDEKRLKTKKFVTSNGELVYSRNEPPVSHPCLKYKSYPEMLQNLDKEYDMNRPMIGLREVLDERTEMDENGM